MVALACDHILRCDSSPHSISSQVRLLKLNRGTRHTWCFYSQATRRQGAWLKFVLFYDYNQTEPMRIARQRDTRSPLPCVAEGWHQVPRTAWARGPQIEPRVAVTLDSTVERACPTGARWRCNPLPQFGGRIWPNLLNWSAELFGF